MKLHRKRLSIAAVLIVLPLALIVAKNFKSQQIQTQKHYLHHHGMTQKLKLTDHVSLKKVAIEAGRRWKVTATIHNPFPISEFEYQWELEDSLTAENDTPLTGSLDFSKSPERIQKLDISLEKSDPKSPGKLQTETSC